MTNHRNDLVAIGGCVLLIFGALLLLSYGRAHQVPSILFFGFVLDAVAFTGIVGNLIVFLLAKVTNLRPLRIACWTFLIVTVVPIIALAVIGSTLDTNFKLSSVVIGYTVSFFFWYGLHWLWANRMHQGSSEAN